MQPRRFWRRALIGATLFAGLPAAVLTPRPVFAQQLDLTHGGPIDITASEGIEWRQAEQQVIARGDAKAIRGNVTVTADRLTAWYRKKKPETASAAQSASAQTAQPRPAGTAAATSPTTSPTSSQGSTQASAIGGDTSTEGSEIYRLQADGNVHIFTQTDQAQGDKAVYDLDQAVMVMTGRNLKLTTPNDVITARDDLEYWPQKRMAVARGNAVVVTSDAKRVGADTLVAYTTESAPDSAPKDSAPKGSAAKTPAAKTPAGTPAAGTPAADPNGDPLAASGKLQRVEAFGHVSIRTPTDTVTGDRGVYVAETGMARLAGNVQINRGQNQLTGAEADVNMKTGIAKLISAPASRVHGLVVPNDDSNKDLANSPAVGAGTGAPSGNKTGKAPPPAAQPGTTAP